MSELESLFSAAAPPLSASAAEKLAKKTPSKQEKIHLVFLGSLCNSVHQIDQRGVMEICNCGHCTSARLLQRLHVNARTKISSCFVQVDMRRANNCEIMLTKVKVPLPEVIVSYLETLHVLTMIQNLHLLCCILLLSGPVGTYADIPFFVCI